MNLTMWLYLTDVAEGLKFFFGFVTLVAGAGFAITIWVGFCMADHTSQATDGNWLTWRKFLYLFLGTFVPTCFMYLATPTKNTLYLMMGANAAEQIVMNPKVQQTGGKVLELINKKLEEALSDK